MVFSKIVFIFTTLLAYLQRSKFTVLTKIKDSNFSKKGKNLKIDLEELQAWIFSFWRIVETKLDIVKC